MRILRDEARKVNKDDSHEFGGVYTFENIVLHKERFKIKEESQKATEYNTEQICMSSYRFQNIVSQ